MSKSSDIDFALFLETWNILQDFETPAVHTRITDWLQESWDEDERQMLLMAFRSCGKSTLVGLFCAWLLWRDPSLRIMVLAAESNLAGKMVRNIKKIVERHPFTKGLKPDNPDQWASDRFTIKRDIEMRDPSVLAAGITSNITGNRADLIIYDDVEVPNTCDSADKRENLRDRLIESQFILAAGGRQLYVGTPHTYFSIYAKSARHEIGEDVPFLNGYKRLKIPILNEKNKSVWPERYPEKEVAAMKRQAGPNKFYSQMMLEPKNVLDSRLDINLLRFYDDALDVHEAQGQLQLKIDDTKLTSVSAWGEPAFGSAKGDASVLAVIYSDNEGNRYLQHIEYISITDDVDDEAWAQCKIVCDFVKKYHLPSISIETNGIGQFLPGVLKTVLNENHLSCAVVEKHSAQKKELRILEAYDALMAARALHVHNSVIKTPYLTEMAEWQPERKNNKDDGLDAVAGALSLEPVRFKRTRYEGSRPNWMGTGSPYQASSDFDV